MRRDKIIKKIKECEIKWDYYSKEDALEYLYSFKKSASFKTIFKDAPEPLILEYAWTIGYKQRRTLRDYIYTSLWAYRWALCIGDREIMRRRVRGGIAPYMWAMFIGDEEIMRERVTNRLWEKIWNNHFKNKVKNIFLNF